MRLKWHGVIGFIGVTSIDQRRLYSSRTKPGPTQWDESIPGYVVLNMKFAGKRSDAVPVRFLKNEESSRYVNTDIGLVTDVYHDAQSDEILAEGCLDAEAMKAVGPPQLEHLVRGGSLGCCMDLCEDGFLGSLTIGPATRAVWDGTRISLSRLSLARLRFLIEAGKL